MEISLISRAVYALYFTTHFKKHSFEDRWFYMAEKNPD